MTNRLNDRCQFGSPELVSKRLARLGFRLNIFFLLAELQAIHTFNRATYTLFASINPSNLQSDIKVQFACW